MAQADPRIKKLKIQTGVVKRLTKEKAAYEKEMAETQTKIDKLMKEGSNRFVVSKQEEVLEESRRVIPDVLRKLKTACEELGTLMESGQSDLAETEEYKTAQTAMEAAKAVLDQSSSREALAAAT
ncbi:tubulin-specific chaperone A-like [Babylonia areolata]|uniref:tubulin-specific chaperone A-like n=1 Tax=Babylonia areolata TaxID=304850 RepID=UPI003FD19444